MKKLLLSALVAIVAVVVLNILARYAYARFDLTEDKRYTLSQPAVDVAQKFDSPGPRGPKLTAPGPRDPILTHIFLPGLFVPGFVFSY